MDVITFILTLYIDVRYDILIFIVSSIDWLLARVLVEEVLDGRHFHCLKVDLLYNFISCSGNIIFTLLDLSNDHTIDHNIKQHSTSHQYNRCKRHKLFKAFETFDLLAILLVGLLSGQISAVFGGH